MAAFDNPTEHRLAATPETVHVGFWDNSLRPVLTVNPGDIVSLETMTAMGGRLRPGITLDELLELRRTHHAELTAAHSLTGPIYVDGAVPGDVLQVQILELVPCDYGLNWVFPGSYGLGALPEDFPKGAIRSFQWGGENASFVSFGKGIRLPLRPFMGVMGVAPATPGRISTIRPGPHGGNMDLKELVAGASLYLPIFVPGALFSTGDAHAVQGDGEVCVAALETAMKTARFRFILRRDLRLERPMAETATHWITMGFHPDLDEAARIALRDAIKWLVQNEGLTREEAYQLASMAVDMRITQLVDGDKGAHAMIPKDIFFR